MNVLTQVISDIQKMKIPVQILNIAFANSVNSLNVTAPVSLTERIMQDVIRPVVLKDLKNISGKHVLIPLTDDKIIGRSQGLYGGQVVTYYIKPEAIENREIVSALSVSYTPYLATASNNMASAAASFYNNTSDMSSTSMRLMDSSGSIPIVSTAQVELVGTHTVVVRNSLHESRLFDLRCVISSDEDLNIFTARATRHVRQLCVYAIQAYIYNKLNVELDSGFLQAGRELSAIKNRVDEWADSAELYETYLRENMSKAAFSQDFTRMNRFIALQMNPSI